MPLPPPDSLALALADRYHIENELGEGGMATVYLAEDLKHGRRVAIKVLRNDVTAALAKERFLREIAISARLSHPHILALFDSGEADGRLFFVMPFMDGTTLRERLKSSGPLPINDVVRALRDVADAMAYAHHSGVVHRDLKPENVVCTGRHALVTDFGVAKALKAAAMPQTFTTLGVAIGTPRYMSPEQSLADPNLDHRSDIYSFGVMAYELLTGKPPFLGATPQEVLSQHFSDKPAPIAAQRPGIPPALASLVMRCLEKRPGDRWQNAEEIVAQLELLITPASTSALLRLPGRGRQRAVFAGATLLVALSGGVMAYRSQGDGAKTHKFGDPVWVAVMPPRNVGDSAVDWYADGLAEELRGALARIPGAFVKGSRSSQAFDGTTKPVAEIGRTLNVPWIIESAVLWTPSGNGSGRLHATAELLEARTETVHWRTAYDTVLADLQSGQAAVAAHFARDIADALGLREHAVLAASAPTLLKVKPEAYAAYLAGRAKLNTFSDDGIRRALVFFRRAIKLDPTFAKPYAWLAFTLYFSGPYTSGDVSAARSADSTEMYAAARNATALSPTDPDALHARAWLRSYDWDWQEARSDFIAVLAQDPQNGFALWGLSEIEAALGNSDRAVELGHRASTIDPLTSGDIYPMVLRMAGRMDEALAAARAGLAVDSLSTSNLWWFGVAFVMAYHGDVEGYRHAMQRQFATGRTIRLDFEVPALARAGRREEARAVLARMLAAPRGHSLVDIARGYAALGETDSAFMWLNRAVQRHDGAVNIATDPFMARLRPDPRYAGLLHSMGLR